MSHHPIRRFPRLLSSLALAPASALALMLLLVGGCDDTDLPNALAESDEASELEREERTDGAIVHRAIGEEDAAIAEFSDVIAASHLSGEFLVEQEEDGTWALVLLHSEPQAEPFSEELRASEEADGWTPRTTYYHDYVTAIGSGSHGTKVSVGDDQALGWALVSGKTSHMYGSASWDPAVTFVSFTVSETWKGLGISGSIPWGLTGSIGSTYGTYTLSSAGKYGNKATVEWCVTGPKGAAFTSRSLTATLTVKASGKTYMLSKTGTSYFNSDWTNSSNAC